MEESSWQVFVWNCNESVDRFALVYIFAQLLGGVVGAALAYAQYIHAIDIYEGSRDKRTLATAGLFATFPVSPRHLATLDISCYSSWII